MSGGSFEYLFLKDVRDLFGVLETLGEMAIYLREHGSDLGANDTNALVQELRMFERTMEYRVASLRDLWQSAEWRASGDFGEEQLTESIADYQKKRLGA